MTVLDLNLSTGSSFSTCAILEIGPVFDVVTLRCGRFAGYRNKMREDLGERFSL